MTAGPGEDGTRAGPPKAQASDQPSPEQADAIVANVRLVTQALTELSGENLPPGHAGMVFLDGFIERQRLRGDQAFHDKLAGMTACYLGAALIGQLGGRWSVDAQGQLGIDLGADLVAYPFAKTAKQFANGSEDSVLSFFETLAALAAERRSRRP